MIRKTLFVGAILVLASVAVQISKSTIHKALAEDATWVSGPIPQLTTGQSIAQIPNNNCYPNSITYQSFTDTNWQFSSIPRDITSSMCVKSNSLATFGSTSDGSFSFNFIKPQTAYGYRLVDEIGRTTGVIPIPNQKAMIYPAESNNNGGRSIRIYDNLQSNGSFEPTYGSINEQSYKIRSSIPPLKDANGNILYMYNHAFSPNGEWMVAEIQFLGYVRIHTKTKATQLFSRNYIQYGQGFLPSQSLAISDDGNDVLISIFDGDTSIYNLSGCQTVPIVPGSQGGTAPGCTSRALRDNLTSQAPGFRGLAKPEFSVDGKSIKGYLIKTGNLGVTERYSMTLSVAGYQPENLSYLALGDSFSSGEGAYDYEDGTDSKNPKNQCHTSKNSYPYLTAQALGLSDFRSVACSGAKLENYYTEPQGDRVKSSYLGEWLPGIVAQKPFIQKANNANTITISMIGNDIGFGNKVRRCIMMADSCFHFREEREAVADEINSKFDILVEMYQDISRTSGGARVYVLGYPNLFNPNGECGLNALMDSEERQLSQAMVNYLNQTIHRASEKAGVQYIDVQDAFSDRLLCDATTNKAVNGLTAGDNQPGILNGPLGSESYHPNQIGHLLFSQALLAQSDNLTKPMPAPTEKTPIQKGSTPYNQLIGSSVYGSTYKRMAYSDFSGIELLFKGTRFAIKQEDRALKSNTIYQAWFYSDPIPAGTLTTDDKGELTGELNIPQNITPGYHTLHIVGPDISGQDIDLYKTVYLAENETDIDGDLINNTDEKCLATNPSNIDVDRDGIDDACDGQINEPPSDSTPPIVTGSTTETVNNLGWYNSDVTIHWQSSDPEPSSGKPTQPDDTIVTQEGETTTTSIPSCDPLQNCATGSYTSKIDKTAPSLGVPEWSENPKQITNTTELTISAFDNLSGIDSVEYFFGDIDPGIGNGAKATIIGDVARATIGTDLAPGVYSISIRAIDKAGNWSALTNDQLVIYGPSDLRISGRASLVPTLANGAILPGLVSDNQNNKFRAGFMVRFNKSKQLLAGSKFGASYHTGARCNNPKRAINCHTFILHSTNIDGIVFSGATQEVASFTGHAKLNIDGQSTNVAFRVAATDQQRTGKSFSDDLSLWVYPDGADVLKSQPIYKVSGDVSKGDIVIKKK